jgi:soluble lytic murein transglycosylase-like protein
MPRHAPPDVTSARLAKPAVAMGAAPSRSHPEQRGLRQLRLVAGVALMGLLAACAAHAPHLSASQQAAEYKNNASGDYRPPGPADDPWGPYIAEAAQRFDVPRSWIRNVMHTESGGQLYVNGQLVTSPVGAMGLMQLMPETYQELEGEYGLGDDPYSPHDNIMAGTAYLREMYDLFGSPGFLAAYNAGPQRLNEYLTDGRPLPDETTHYVAMIEPYIQGDMPAGRSPADQFAMNSMSAPSGRAYNGGAGASLAETGGGLVSGGGSDSSSLAETGGGLVSGGAHGGGSAAVMAMNEAVSPAPDGAGGPSGTDALNSQQVAVHSAQLLADGGGAVPADLMTATDDPRPAHPSP